MISDLPPGWRLTTVGEAGRLDLGRQRHPDWHQGPEMRPYLRVANVFEDRIDTADVKEMDFSQVFERFRLAPGDVLLNEGQTPELLGRPAIYRGIPSNVAFTNTLIRFRPHSDVTSEWALAVFRHYMHSGRFKKESRITTNIAHLSLTRLKSVEFPVPPLAEQRRIVQILEDHLSRLEAAERYLAAVTLKATGARGAVIHAALQSRRTRSAITITGSLAAERASRCPENMKRGRPSALPPADVETPWGGRWPTVSLEQATDPVRTISYGILKPGPDLEGGVPYVRVINMRNDALDVKGLHRTSAEIAAMYARTTLLAGDVLVSIRGTYGRVVVVPESLEGANITQDTARLALLPQILPDFAALVLRSPFVQAHMKRVARGVAVKGVNIADLRAVPFPVPPLDEQRAIVERAAALHSDLAAAMHSATMGGHRVPTLRRALLRAACDGRLTGDSSDVRSVQKSVHV